MVEEKPSIIILHGDDTFAGHKFIASLEAKLGDPAMADLNTVRLDGRQVGEDEIRSAAFAMPFLTERRLVVLTNPLARYSGKGGRDENLEETAGQSSSSARAGREKFLALLASVPPTTALVLVIDDSRVRRRGEWQWEVLTPTHWLTRWANQAGKQVWIKECSLPSVEEMPGWVRKRAEGMKGQFTPQAARALADHVGTDTQLASQEVAKLLTYVDYRRPVEEDDVALLTAQTNQASVFTLVDAMGERNCQLALQTLHLLMEENDPIELFGMMVRQFRLLLQAREVLDEGSGVETISSEVKERSGASLHPYVAQKLASQAQRFSLPALEAIYRRLLEIDVALKTSQTSPEVAFDTFIVELAA